MSVSTICPTCGKEVSDRTRNPPRKFCSSRCYWDSLRGKPTPIPRHLLGGDHKAHGAWLRGKPQSRSHVEKRAAAVARTLAETRRTCVQCGETFTPTQTAQRYCSGQCWNTSHRGEKTRTARFRIPPASYQRLLERQRYKCAICGALHESNERKDRLCVDHVHGTDRVRGLLCHRCNTAIGLFRDDRELLRRARIYLTRRGRRRWSEET